MLWPDGMSEAGTLLDAGQLVNYKYVTLRILEDLFTISTGADKIGKKTHNRQNDEGLIARDS